MYLFRVNPIQTVMVIASAAIATPTAITVRTALAVGERDRVRVEVAEHGLGILPTVGSSG